MKTIYRKRVRKDATYYQLTCETPFGYYTKNLAFNNVEMQYRKIVAIKLGAEKKKFRDAVERELGLA